MFNAVSSFNQNGYLKLSRSDKRSSYNKNFSNQTSDSFDPSFKGLKRVEKTLLGIVGAAALAVFHSAFTKSTHEDFNRLIRNSEINQCYIVDTLKKSPGLAKYADQFKTNIANRIGQLREFNQPKKRLFAYLTFPFSIKEQCEGINWDAHLELHKIAEKASQDSKVAKEGIDLLAKFQSEQSLLTNESLIYDKDMPRISFED